MRKNTFAGLGMVDGAAGEIAANRHANHRRRSPCAIRAPAHQGKFVVNLVHRGPDVIEELYLDYRLHAAHRITHRPTNNVGLGQWRIEDSLGSEFSLQAGGQLEDAALALDLVQSGLAAGVGDVFAINHNAWIAAHLVMQASIDEVGHGARRTALFTASLASTSWAGQVYLRVDLLGGKQRTGGVQIFGI